MAALIETLSNAMPNTLGHDPMADAIPDYYSDLAAISRAFGPKTVKTKHIEVTQFSPQEIAMLQDRANALSAYPDMCAIFSNACIAEPDENAYRPNYERGNNCGCS